MVQALIREGLALPKQSHQKSKSKSVKVKGAKRRLRFLFFVLTCFFAWAGFTLWHQNGQISDSISRLAALEVQLAEIQADSDQLKEDITKLHDPEYIEQILRRDLQMVRQGETLFLESN